MTSIADRIRQCEERADKALWSLEVPGRSAEALAVYEQASADLEQVLAQCEPAAEREAQRALAYCLMRQGNMLRVLGRAEDAARVSEREIAAARASGDALTLARSLMSHGTNVLVSGGRERGLALLSEAQDLFARGDGSDFRQGLGWCWILRADLINAGLISGDPAGVATAAGRALEALLPIDNWPGIARAYAARAKARERLGDAAGSTADLEAQREAETRIPVEEPGERR